MEDPKNVKVHETSTLYTRRMQLRMQSLRWLEAGEISADQFLQQQARLNAHADACEAMQDKIWFKLRHCRIF